MNRPVPVTGPDDEAFWRGGGDGKLLVHRCRACRRWYHPPAPVCPRCYSRDVAPEPTAGRGEVWAHTVNHQPWFAGMPPPYVVAIVELAEQPGLRLTTNIVGCPPGDVRAGLAVEACFQQVAADVWLPLFRPAGR